MSINTTEVYKYKNFQALATDVIVLAKEVMPDKIIYINSLNDQTQITLKVSEHNTSVTLEEGTEIPVEAAICNKIDYAKGEPLVYEDIKGSRALTDIQSTIDSLNVNAYLGVPIVLSDGLRFGTLCAAHHEAQTFSDKEIMLLQKIANMFSYYLELEHKAYRDALTGLFNYQYLHTSFHELAPNGGIMMMLDLDHFKSVNDTYGHLVGNRVLQTFAYKLRSFSDPIVGGTAFRLGGDEFLLIIPKTLEPIDLTALLEQMLETFGKWEDIVSLPLTASIGVIHYDCNGYQTVDDLLKIADKALYEAKETGKNCYTIVS